MSEHSEHDAPRDLTRCSHCGRAGTLTSLSAGNTCVQQDECEQARQEAIAQVAAMTRDNAKAQPSSEDVMGPYSADWFDNPHLVHGGQYGVRGPKGLVKATGSFKADWERAQALAAEMNAAHSRHGRAS